MVGHAAEELNGGLENTLGAIREIASLINASNDYDELLDHIVRSVCQHLKWSRCAILVIDRARALSNRVAFCDTDDDEQEAPATSWDLATSPTLKVIESRTPLVLHDPQNDDRFPSFRESAICHRLHKIVLLPLSTSDLRGREMVFSVGLRGQDVLGDRDLDSLSTISHLISIAVAKLKLFRAEQSANENLRDLLDSNSRLMQRIIGGCAMDDVAELVALQVRHPFAIYDRVSDSFLWSGKPEPVARAFSDGTAAAALDAELRRHLIKDRPGAWSTPSQVAIACPGWPRGLTVILQPLMVSEQMLGGLAIFPKSAQVSDFERLQIQGVQFAISAHLMRTYAQWTQRTTAVAAFFGRLFDGEWHSIDQVEAMADSIGIDFTASARLLVIDLTAVASESALLSRPIEMAARQIFPAAAVFPLNHVLFVYLPLPERGGQNAIQRLAEEVDAQIQWRTGMPVAMTVSPVCKAPKDFKPARGRSMQVLRLARLFRKTGLVDSADFGSFALLVSALGEEAMAHFLEETLAPIIEHDKARKGSLLRCAEAFLKQGCRYQAAADALGIHVSTLRYRLKRLSELFGLDLDSNEDDRFTLSLALRIHELRS